MKQHGGFTLIELLVAISLSFILLAMLLYIFMFSKRAYLLTSNYSQLQENAQVIMNSVTNTVRLSGYRSTPNKIKFSDSSNIFTSANPYVSVGAGTNGNATLTVRYQGSGDGQGNPDGLIRDCLNRSVDANVMATNVFSINANLDLQCQATNPSASPQISSGTIATGVQNMQVLLGEDLNGDASADRYVSSTMAGINYNNIMSIRMAFLLRSTDDINPSTKAKTYDLCGTTVSPPLDKKLRQCVTLTVQLRNRCLK